METFFHIFTHGGVSNAQTWEISAPKKSSRATLIQTFCASPNATQSLFNLLAIKLRPFHVLVHIHGVMNSFIFQCVF